MKDRAKIGRAWLERVHEKCPGVKFIGHYAILGPYDFLDIYEAPDEETAAKVSMISLVHGAVQAESWVAIPYKRARTRPGNLIARVSRPLGAATT